MSAHQILLELDGSAQSRYAAELVWALAKEKGWTVNAQHVVDSLAAWDFLNFDIAGFIGSGPYFEAHETMRNCLTKIGENLVEAYLGNAAGHEIDGGAFLDDGTTIREICWRAKDHALVVIGQRSTGMASPDEDKRRLPRRSIAETLTYYCPRPLLVVQDRMSFWKKARILVSSTAMPEKLIGECLRFLKATGAQTHVTALYVNEALGDETKSNDAKARETFAQLEKKCPEFAGVSHDSLEVGNLFKYFGEDSQVSEDTLLVVPVAEMDGTRRTCFGMSPDLILRYQTHAGILFWIESPPADEFEEEKASSAAKSE